MRRYDLTFIEVAERCLNGKGFIRGENFAPGTYVKVENGVLVLKDKKGNDSFPLPISKGFPSQKYKLFYVATDEELGIYE